MKKEEMKKVMNEVVVFTKEQKEEYKSACRQIVSSMKSLETSFIKLALALHNVDSGKLYEIEGYKNIYEFAKERYNISKSTCYNYLGLVDAFGLTADSKPLYTYTQMVALLPAVRAGVDIEAKISPNMSVSEIKKLRCLCLIGLIRLLSLIPSVARRKCYSISRLWKILMLSVMLLKELSVKPLKMAGKSVF